MKYIINHRGGAKTIDNQLLEKMLASGCIEITKQQFDDNKYYPEYDKGSSYKGQTAPAPKVQNQKTTERKSFQTRIV